MESLVVLLNVKILEFSDYEVVILGGNGYIGRIICSYLESSDVIYKRLDTRTSGIQEFISSNRLFVIDCSRVTDFGKENLKNDTTNHLRTLSAISLRNGFYLRIGSCLELIQDDKRDDYTSWSRNKTRLTESLDLKLNYLTMFVPNIYGGNNSTSIIDRMKYEFALGKKLMLNNPENYRDFLHVQRFIESLDILFNSPQIDADKRVAITSGIAYQIGSIQQFIHSGNPIELKNVSTQYNEINKCIVLPDDLVNYFSDF
jgi:nucleoside-diphosphate-sugar epimerase